MTSLPTDSIQVSDNGIVVDAELLAACLELSAASLRKTMSDGDVRTLVEFSEGGDLGWIQLTLT